MFRPDPHSAYRYFFPFSIAGALVGLAQFLFSYNAHGIIWHREIMITLFLLPAAAGFIYTAAPRFLNAKPATETDIYFMMTAFTALFLAYLMGSITAFYFLKLIALTLLFVFFVFRWWKGKANNPYWPPFIITSLCIGLFSTLLQIIQIWARLPLFWTDLSAHLYYDAMFWVLLFGIGLKFFPMLTGAVPPVYQKNKFNFISKDQYESSAFWFTIAALALASFILQEIIPPVWGLTLRAILVLFMAYQGWALFEKPQRKGYTTQMLRIFLITIVLGHLLFIALPEQRVHIYHIVFVGGFLSLTLAVESRVILSHEHMDLQYEQSSPWQLTAYLLFYSAMLLRIITPFIPQQYTALLHFASATATAGVLIMLVQIGKMLLARHKSG